MDDALQQMKKRAEDAEHKIDDLRKAFFHWKYISDQMHEAADRKDVGAALALDAENRKCRDELAVALASIGGPPPSPVGLRIKWETSV